MTNFKGISKIKKDKASKIIIETDLVNQYKNAITNLFNTVSFEKDSLGNRNSFYYSDYISNFSNSLNKELQSNKELSSLKEIEIFNRTTIDLLNEIVRFFIALNKYDSKNNKVIEDIFLTKTNIDDGFINLGQFDLKIKDYFTKKDSSIAMKEYCLNVIKKSLYFLNNSLYISINKCPLKSDYDNLIYNLEHSINSTEVYFKPILDSNKIPDKWYALLYWFELMANGEKPPKKIGGNFNKSKIKEIGITKCKNSGEYFYKSFKDIDISNQMHLKAQFGTDWKEEVKKLSNNNTKISKYIEKNYNN